MVEDDFGGNVRRRIVVGGFHLGGQQGFHSSLQRRVVGLIDEVVQFVRILLNVKQYPRLAVHSRIQVSFRADAAPRTEARLAVRHVVLQIRGDRFDVALARQGPRQIASLHVGRYVESAKAQNRRCHVDVREDRVAHLPGLDPPRIANDAGNADRLLERLALQEHALRAEHVPVIRRENDQCVRSQIQRVEHAEQSPDVVVDRGDHCVVLGNVLARTEPRARLPVRAHRQRGRIIQTAVLGRRLVRVVRRAHSDHEKERFVTIRPHELDRQIGPHDRLELFNRDRGRIVAEVRRIKVAMGTFVGSPKREALASRSGRNEARLPNAAVEMPLADESGGVAGVTQQLGDRDL